jgi:hypothetical protein
MVKKTCVSPDGSIGKDIFYGKYLGNRGCLHGKSTEIKKPFVKNKPWIYCVTDLGNGKRLPGIMHPGSYTVLFFWDDVTALAAGHRPCFYCQREKAENFVSSWWAGNPHISRGLGTGLTNLDQTLHSERIDNNNSKITFNELLGNLPSGVIVKLLEIETHPCLLWDGKLYPWDENGYGNPLNVDNSKSVSVLTPASVVNALRFGLKVGPRFE